MRQYFLIKVRTIIKLYYLVQQLTPPTVVSTNILSNALLTGSFGNKGLCGYASSKYSTVIRLSYTHTSSFISTDGTLPEKQ